MFKGVFIMAASEKPAKVRILELLKVNPSKKFTYGQISDELKLSKTNIGKLINPMAKAGKLLVKKIGNQKIVKSMASSSSDQTSSSIHSSSSEKENKIDLTEDRDFNLGSESSSSDQTSSSIHSSSSEKENNVDLTEDRDFNLGSESSSSDQTSSSIHSSSSENPEFTVQEKSDLATTVLNWIQGYRINVVRNPNGKQAILEMPRMLKLYKKLTGYEYLETKNDKFKEYLSKIKKMEENQS